MIDRNGSLIEVSNTFVLGVAISHALFHKPSVLVDRSDQTGNNQKQNGSKEPREGFLKEPFHMTSLAHQGLLEHDARSHHQ
jgi:hypothetical protein